LLSTIIYLPDSPAPMKDAENNYYAALLEVRACIDKVVREDSDTDRSALADAWDEEYKTFALWQREVQRQSS
jgi:hypothetical protein